MTYLYIIGFCLFLAYLLKLDLRYRHIWEDQGIYIRGRILIASMIMALFWPVALPLAFIIGSRIRGRMTKNSSR